LALFPMSRGALNTSWQEPADGRFAQVMHSLRDTDFAKFQRLIENESGIHLPSSKKPLLVGRLSRRLRELGLSELPEYYAQVIADPRECARMIDCISTNETQFFREPAHFEFLTSQLFPQWNSEALAGRRLRSVRAWSVGCSTGEEPYSLAMTLLHFFPPASGWRIEVLATDISNRVLARAQAGTWPIEKARQIPEPYLKSFMLRGVGEQEGVMKVGGAISSVVRFAQGNLLREAAKPVAQGFDIIFCRNVLIYFQPEVKAQAASALLNHLGPGGYLFVGHSESLNNLIGRVRTVIPTVYERMSEDSPK